MTFLERHRSWMLPTVAGLLLGGIYYLPWLLPNLIALIPLMMRLDESPAEDRFWKRLRPAWWAGILAQAIGCSFTLALSRFSLWAIFLYPALVILLGLKVGLIASIAASIRRRLNLPWVAVLPPLWVAGDYLLSFGDLRLTADHLYHGMASYPLWIQAGDLIGPYGITLVVVAIQALLYAGVRGSRTSLVAVGLLVAALLGYGWTAPGRLAEPVGSLRVAIVQPDVRMLIKWDDDANQQQWEKLERLSHEAVAAGAEVLVWPETSYPWPMYHWVERPETYRLAPVERLAADLNVTIVTGVEYVRVRSRDDYDLFNAVMVVTPEGLQPEWTAKRYLVPFTEKLPFRRIFGGLIENRDGIWRWIAGGFEEGQDVEPLTVADSQVRALVCYEQLFSDLFRDEASLKSQWFAVVTNDAWFARTPFQDLQAQAVRLRAIETRRDVVRAANTGISAVATADGRLLQPTALYEEAIVIQEIELREGSTVYSRSGDVAAWVSLAAALALALLARMRRD